MTQPDLVRPRYRENQQLSVDDLDTEQAYLIATRRRHDVTAHTAGVAAEGATVAAETGTTVRLGADPSVTIVVPDANGQPVPRFAVSPANGTDVNGTVVAGDAKFAGDDPLRFGAPVPAPQAARPWRWYRAETMAGGVVTGQQLRVELAAPPSTGKPDWFRFAVKDGSGTFPLTIDAGGATRIGSLKVEGTLVFGPLAPDPGDARLAATLVRTWTAAVDQSSRAVDRQFSGDLFDTSALTVKVTVVSPQSAQTATPPPPPTLTYTVTVTNGSHQPVTDLTIAAVNTINNAQSSERLVRLNTPLSPGTHHTLTHNLPLPGVVEVTVHVEVVALGLLPGGKVTLGIANFDWQSPNPIQAPSPRTGRFPWR